MNNALRNDQNQGLEALYMELEGRYGPAMAQDIVDQVKKAENKQYVPDYMPIKALSEAIEVLRPEAQVILKKLKDSKEQGAEIIDFEAKRLEQDFKHMFDCYWQLQKTFYNLYGRCMSAYAPTPSQKSNYRLVEKTEPIKAAA